MINYFKALGACILMAASCPAAARVNFAEFTVTQIISPEALQLAGGTSTTARVAGLAAYPEVDGPLYALHMDTEEHLTVLRVQAHTEGATWLTDAVAMSTHLGGTYQQKLTPVAGVGFDTATNSIYFAEDFNGSASESSLIKINATTGIPAVISRSAEVAAFADLAVLPGGKIVAARPGAADVGVMESTGVWATVVTEADLLAAAPGKANLPPVAVATSPEGMTFLHCAGDRGLFSIAGVAEASPVITFLPLPELASVDFADIAADQRGNLFGLDVAGRRIVAIRASDNAVFTVALAEIASAIGDASTFEASPAGSLTARTVGRGQVDLFVASSNGDHGIARIRFGVHPASVAGWELYD